MIEYDDKYSEGISMIDEEHKEFMAIINKVTIAKQGNYSQEKAKEILNELVKFAKEHFKTEEDYMSKF
ncbi:MAG: bacteriohemerythrin [Candidatus Scalindua sp.]